jgi:hypothetical protein
MPFPETFATAKDCQSKGKNGKVKTEEKMENAITENVATFSGG